MGGIISEEPEKPALTAQSTVETVDSGPTAVSPPPEQIEDVPGEPRHSRHSIMVPRDTRVRASQTVSERPSDATESDGEQEFHQPRHSRASLMIFWRQTAIAQSNRSCFREARRLDLETAVTAD